MTKYFKSTLGRYRLLVFLEGLSLILLMFIAMPMKYIWEDPFLVKVIGQIHGILFLLFVFQTIRIGTELGWKFTGNTMKMLLSSIIPFASFYVDSKILSKVEID